MVTRYEIYISNIFQLHLGVPRSEKMYSPSSAENQMSAVVSIHQQSACSLSLQVTWSEKKLALLLSEALKHQMCVNNTQGFKSHPRQRLLPLMSVHFDQSLWLSSAITGCHGSVTILQGWCVFAVYLARVKWSQSHEAESEMSQFKI